MKVKGFIILLFVYSMNVSSQCLPRVLSEIYNAREVFFLKEFPDTFSFYYEQLFLNSKMLQDQIETKISDEDFHYKADTIVLIEGVHLPSYKIIGLFRFNKRNLYYTKEYHDSILNFKVSNYNKKDLDYFLEDVIVWNENVTNRSYYNTFISGAFMFVCSRVVDNVIITTAFAEYNKNANIIFLKEKKDENYKCRKLVRDKTIYDNPTRY